MTLVDAPLAAGWSPAWSLSWSLIVCSHTARSSAAAPNASRARSEPEREECWVARSLAETLTDAAREAVETSEWERDQEARNLPRADGGPAGAVEDGETAAEEGVSEESRGDPPTIPPETAE